MHNINITINSYEKVDGWDFQSPEKASLINPFDIIILNHEKKEYFFYVVIECNVFASSKENALKKDFKMRVKLSHNNHKTLIIDSSIFKYEQFNYDTDIPYCNARRIIKVNLIELFGDDIVGLYTFKVLIKEVNEKCNCNWILKSLTSITVI